MSIQILRRWGVMLLLAALLSGCSLIGLGRSDHTASDRGPNECTGNQRGCDYNGHYDPGERAYAEQEARQLNQAELDRLRRSGL